MVYDNSDSVPERLLEISNKMAEMICELNGLDGGKDYLVSCGPDGFTEMFSMFVMTIDRIVVSITRETFPISEEDVNKITEPLRQSLSNLTEAYEKHSLIAQSLVTRGVEGLN